MKFNNLAQRNNRKKRNSVKRVLQIVEVSTGAEMKRQ